MPARKASWAWTPVFNYLQHDRHAQAAKKFVPTDQLNIVPKITLIGETTGANCETCHHTYDDKQKALIYQKNSENSCRACHKTADDKNARSMKKAAHAACIGCHMKLAAKVKAAAVKQGRTQLSEHENKRFGPFECQGCHEKHKTLTPDEIKKVPRLVRGQKDVMDVSMFKEPDKDFKLIKMKLVPFNHKIHETTGQFCSSCHHYSIEKCSGCHTAEGDPKKGGGVSYEEAYHRVSGKQSCLGCHNFAKQDKNCAGCHQRQTTAQTLPAVACAVCHRGPSEGKLVEAPLLPVQFDKEKVPEKVLIKTLEKDYKPADMQHQKMIKKLTLISNENSLARFFHAAEEQALCYGCHHQGKIAAANKFPDCSACHKRLPDPKNPAKPVIMAAFHQQCVGCHKAMGQKPAPLDCDKCHPEKGQAKADQTAVLLRRIPEQP
jgi:hypothetical protein